MEQRNQALRADVAGERFLSDLRALRTRAGLDHGQLAARSHYPRDVIAAAEAGPRLPALPVLAAYVRGCGGTGDEILAWEDRWRAVTGSKAHPLLSARVAGLSGANRPLSPETSDPTVIRSALQRFGNRMSQPGPSSVSSPSSPIPPEAPAPAEAPTPTQAPTPPRPEAHREEPETPAPVKPTVPTPTVAPPAPAPASATPAPAASSAPAAPAAPEPGSSKGRTITIAAIVAVIVILLIIAVAL